MQEKDNLQEVKSRRPTWLACRPTMRRQM